MTSEASLEQLVDNALNSIRQLIGRLRNHLGDEEYKTTLHLLLGLLLLLRNTLALHALSLTASRNTITDLASELIHREVEGEGLRVDYALSILLPVTIGLEVKNTTRDIRLDQLLRYLNQTDTTYYILETTSIDETELTLLKHGLTLLGTGLIIYHRTIERGEQGLVKLLVQEGCSRERVLAKPVAANRAVGEEAEKLLSMILAKTLKAIRDQGLVRLRDAELRELAREAAKAIIRYKNTCILGASREPPAVKEGSRKYTSIAEAKNHQVADVEQETYSHNHSYHTPAPAA